MEMYDDEHEEKTGRARGDHDEHGPTVFCRSPNYKLPRSDAGERVRRLVFNYAEEDGVIGEAFMALLIVRNPFGLFTSTTGNPRSGPAI